MDPLLTETQRSKRDDGDDGAFYDRPRFVTHADEPFLARLRELYASVTRPGDRVLDAMSSWVSHLPDTEYDRVVGHGLNEAELDANDALDEWFVRDFNREPSLPPAEETFDAVCCALSVQYLQFPGAVFAEFERVLVDDGVLVVSFSDRMFPSKAVQAWRAASIDGRLDLVRSYCAAGGLAVADTVRERPGGDPFCAVLARPSDR